MRDGAVEDRTNRTRRRTLRSMVVLGALAALPVPSALAQVRTSRALQESPGKHRRVPPGLDELLDHRRRRWFREPSRWRNRNEPDHASRSRPLSGSMLAIIRRAPVGTTSP